MSIATENVASSELNTSNNGHATPSTSRRTSAITDSTNSSDESVIEMLRETTVHLNNTAVTLLGTYNNYVAAVQTMKDALELLSKSINTTSAASSGSISSSNSSNRTLSIADIYDLHQLVISNAANRLQIEATKLDPLILPGPLQPPPYSPDVTVDNDETPKMNDIGVVVLPSNYNPNDAYHLLATIRTSKVAIRIVGGTTTEHHEHNSNNNDYYTNLHVVRSILVYNYGIAHRCCIPKPSPVSTTEGHHNGVVTNDTNNKIGAFCLQIFQYAEQLLIPAIERNNNASIHHDEVSQQQQQPPEPFSALSSAPHNYLLLYRFILTRNLMMLSCKMGMLLCELYKQTLDPIESEILLLPPQPPNRHSSHEPESHHRPTTTPDTRETFSNASAA